MIPKEGTINWWTFLGLIDTRLDLTKSSALFSYLPQVGTLKTVFGVNLLELLLMASKIAYENAAVVEYAVTQRWKVGFWFLLGDAKGFGQTRPDRVKSDTRCKTQSL